jgi:hypothetical protein
MNLKQIIDAILKLAEKEKHPDKVTGIHTVLMQVNMKTGKEMERIRDDERRKF